MLHITSTATSEKEWAIDQSLAQSALHAFVNEYNACRVNYNLSDSAMVKEAYLIHMHRLQILIKKVAYGIMGKEEGEVLSLIGGSWDV